MNYDVIVVGAGVIGGMLARELSRYQLSLCLLEKENDVARGASAANSGIIHGGYDPEPGTLKAQLNTCGVSLLYRAAKELKVPHRNNGSMVCAFGAEEEEHIRTLYDRGVENGIWGFRILTGAEARAMEPSLSENVTLALWVPTAGIISPYELNLAAVGNAMDNGAHLKCNFRVSKIEPTAEGFLVTSADGQTVQGRFLVNCAGAFSDEIASLAGDDFFRICPRAGEYLLLDQEVGAMVSHTIFRVPTKAGKGILVTPTADGNLLLGPTADQVESPFDTQTTAQGLEKVKKEALSMVPSIPLSKVITSFTGIRASTSGGDFIIQSSARVEGLLHLAAIDSPGLTCCVSIARRAVQELEQMGLCLDKKEKWIATREDPRAFQALSIQEKNAWIQRDPSYGRIVCRCEKISEGEILNAIRQNPPARDLDGVKRRTRSGMGRCQGGFCAPHVMRLLGAELEIPQEEVTKSGGGSVMIKGRIG